MRTAQATLTADVTVPLDRLSLASRACGFCRGVVQERAEGTNYCCSEAELESLRGLTLELAKLIAIELEEPPADPHTVRTLSLIRARLRRARRMS